MTRNKLIGSTLIIIAIIGFALSIYQYSINRARIPTVLFSILLLFTGLTIYKRKV